uniref:Peptidyl-tRNA hydrolase isoform X2 n=1 Tax=Rhizophora mucronata TaxID=61149 RepID=A0A2P2IYF0_RHIMU
MLQQRTEIQAFIFANITNLDIFFTTPGLGKQNTSNLSTHLSCSMPNVYRADAFLAGKTLHVGGI